MPKPRYIWQENKILAGCPDCDAITSFDTEGHSGTSLGAVIINNVHIYDGRNFSRILWQFFRRSVCGRGGVAKLHDLGHSQTAALEDFLPQAIERTTLPPSVPEDVKKEFRESELDASSGAYRSASG